MLTTLSRKHLALLAAVVAAAGALAACANQEEGLDVQEGDVTAASADPEAKADLPSVAFTAFSDSAIGFQPAARVLIKTSSAYRSFFGHSAPAAVNFNTDWVVFYSAGQKTTGGYAASIAGIVRSGNNLKVTTSLSSPGPSCFVLQALSNPTVLVKLKKQTTTTTRYYKADTTRDCATCATKTCAPGTHCEIKPVECLVAPCPDLPQCVPNACVQNVLCVLGSHFDNTPGVCKCVPNACVQNVLCVSTSHFDNTPGVCKCVPNADPCATVRCITGTSCHVVNGAAQCTSLCDGVRCAAGSHCVAAGNAVSCQADGPFCGGIAGIACPGAGRCVDNPNDSCDPNAGGADCGGMCQCIQTQACISGSHFNNDPTVCSCVPDAPGACSADSDCRLADDYCTGCDCRALGPGQNLPICPGPGVRCLRQPCGGLTAHCDAGTCVAR